MLGQGARAARRSAPERLTPTSRSEAERPREAGADAGARAGEAALVALLLLGLMLLTVLVASAGNLFGRPLWLDEYHTLFLARADSLGQLVAQLRQGSDFNPPLLYLLARALGAVTDGVQPWTLRLLSFGCAWLALVATYAFLRHHVGRAPSLAGALLLWAHPLVVFYAFDGRFYAPLLLFSALLAWAASAAAQRPGSRSRLAALGVASVLLCTIHYFGLFVWMLVAAAVAVVLRGRPGSLVRVVAPMLAGPLALAACFPIYAGQRGALSVATWVAPVSYNQLLMFLGHIFARPMMWLAPIVWAVWILSMRRQGSIARASEQGGPSRLGMLPMLALATLPCVLILFSLWVQPALIPRYAIPAVLALAPLTALAVSDMGNVAAFGVMVVSLASATFGLHGAAAEARDGSTQLHAQVALLRSLRLDSTPIVAADRHVYYPLAHTNTAISARLRYPAVPDSLVRAEFPAASASGHPGDIIILERDVSRVHQTLYGIPHIVDLRVLQQTPRLYLVGEQTRGFARLFLPGHRVTELEHGVFLAEITPE